MAQNINEAAPFFPRDLDLRGRTVRTVGGKFVYIPMDADRLVSEYHISYSSPKIKGRGVHQNLKSGALQSARYDIAEVVDGDAIPYRFIARRYQDIDLPRIAREIGDVPYAIVEWGNYRVIVAGERARLRGTAVGYPPSATGEATRLRLNSAGRIFSAGWFTRGPHAGGWYGICAEEAAREWWKEVRRRERTDIVVTVTPVVTDQ